MTAPRSISLTKQYRRYRTQSIKNTACHFCDIQPAHPQFIAETNHFVIIQNNFPYSVWDGQRVVRHIMLIPKQHTSSLSALPANARIEYADQLSQYEADGYNVYARAPGSNKKTVAHQHTHLLQLDGKNIRFFAFLRRPYIRIAR